mgnify:FL=1
MKNIILNSLTKFFSFILLVSISFSCEEYLDEDFRDGLSPSNFYNNDNEAIMGLMGAYSQLTSQFGWRHRQRHNWYQMGTDESSSNRNAASDAYNYTHGEGVWDSHGFWIEAYELVRNTNDAILNLEGNDQLTESVKNSLLGEALTLRALAYLDLTNIWGDVPYYRDNMTVGELATLERTPVSTIRPEIEADLQRAFTLLPSTRTGGDLGRVTKWGAMALKAKLHMYDSEWSDMLAACVEIINNSPHTLMDDFADVYNFSNKTWDNQVNNEHIFWIDFPGAPGLGMNVQQRSNTMFEEYSPRLRDEPKNKGDKNALKAALKSNNEDFTGWAGCVPLPDMADQSKWQSGDLRYEKTVTQEYEGIALKFPYYKKLWNLNQSYGVRSNKSSNYVMVRLADIYLMAAEAENELNGPDNAYQYVNKVRERAFDPDQPFSGMTQETFRQAIRDERKWELCGEMHRKQDLIRWGIFVETVQNTNWRNFNKAAAENIKPIHVKCPIPLDEILRNPNLLNTDPTNNGYR